MVGDEVVVEEEWLVVVDKVDSVELVEVVLETLEDEEVVL